MPKQLQEIKTFHIGTIMNADSGDIPIEAASYSLNLDSVTEDGKLKGVPKDLPKTPSYQGGHNVIIGFNPIDTGENGDIDYILVDGSPKLVAFSSVGWRVEN
tara:strand:- start:198 stop:503 length:306 start_codon:yes stop_codon:yes gene_type:complete